jgi:CBS-domain-containing membrane protein
MGYWYVSVLSGVLILLIVALIFNNMTSEVLSKSPKYHKFRKRIHNTLKTNDSILKQLLILRFHLNN